jgi:hypothetical protein
MANGNYDIAQKAGLAHLIPNNPRRYYTVYYSCDSNINNTDDLVKRLCNDTDPEDGLLRLVPDAGKELTEFSRSDEASVGLDLKLVKWGSKGSDSQKYSSVVPNDIIQSFRNFVTGAVDSIIGCGRKGMEFLSCWTSLTLSALSSEWARLSNPSHHPR